MIKKILLSFFFLNITACSLFSPIKTGPTNSYLLNSVPRVLRPSIKSVTLLVMPTESTHLYNTNQMAYSAHPYEVAFFSKNQWAETPAKMLNPLIIQTLHRTQHFHAIVSYPTAAQADYQLNTQLIELIQDFSQNPSQEHLILRINLVNTLNGKVVASKQLTATVNAHEDSPYGGVVAANQATAIVLRELAIFCVKSL